MNLEKVIAVRNNKTVYRDADKCIKIFSSEFPKGDVLNEALNQARIEETGLNIPRILEVTVIEGKWAIISEYIKGKTLAQLMKDNPDRLDAYLELFVDLQMKIHACTAPLLGKLRDKMAREISKSDLDATTRIDLHHRLENMPRHNKVCHGDFNPSNIIVTEDGTPYILDWSHATQGNASADAARTYLLFLLAGDTACAERYLELFCKRSGAQMQYVKKWLPLVAASQSVKGRAKEREFLLSLVNTVNHQ